VANCKHKDVQRKERELQGKEEVVQDGGEAWKDATTLQFADRTPPRAGFPVSEL